MTAQDFLETKGYDFDKENMGSFIEEHYWDEIFDLMKEYYQSEQKDSEIIIGKYHLSKHKPIPLTDQVNVLWINNKSGEGMSIDLDKLWDDNF